MMRALPLLCVDVVLRNREGQVLLVRRKNEPKKGRWWPVGGRVLRGETLRRAAIRKVREETGLAVEGPEPVGYFELINRKGRLPVPGYHTVSVVFAGQVPDGASVRLDGQSSGWKFSPSLPADFRVVPFGGPGTGITGGA